MLGITFSLVLVFLLFSYSDALLAAMSVDFGSQFIKIALVKPGVPMEIVLNKESRRKTPNLIGMKAGERFFGDAALAFAVKNPKNSFVHLVDLLGKNISNPIVSLYQSRFPFVKIVPDETRGTIQFLVNDEKYSVETLVAMILDNARKLTEHFAEQPVKDVVITVPAYFNQAERRAVAKAAEIADLNLLQLLNDHSAAGLSYGIFRRKEITDQAQTLLIYDMGASKTTASILEFRQKEKEKGGEKNPVMSTLGFGYDRTLGGLEISLRMRDYLVEEFKKQKKTNQDITENPRAMAKMFKEAERVKQVLSANADHIAQIESVHEDQDFRIGVTRAHLEKMIKDLEPRITKPIEDALKMAEMTVEKIDQVVLMGAATRMPRVQDLVRNYFKGKELSKFLNTDESIALGAVYQAARLSKGFKVKKFDVRDLQIFPIQVDFVLCEKKGPSCDRVAHRSIYGYKTHYPSLKKTLCFSSLTKDFTFNINYGDLKHLTEKQLIEFGSTNISSVDLMGITKTYESEMSDEGSIYKGVKIHFNMDESGILSLRGAKMYVEKPPKEESAFASLAGKITGLFSSGSSKEAVKEEKEENLEQEGKEEKPEQEGKKAEETKESTEKESDKNTDRKQTNGTGNEDGKSTEEEKKNSTVNAKEKSKPKVKRVSIEVKETRLDVEVPSDSETQSAKKRLSKFVEMEKKRAEREEAHNTLESLVYDVSDKLDQAHMQDFVTPEEKEAISKEIARIRVWLEDEADINTSTEQFLENKKQIDNLLKPVIFRIDEEKYRPMVIADLLSLFNHSEIFVVLGKNLTESGMFTEVEISTLEKVLDEVKTWWKEKNATQMTLKPVDTPAYTVEDVKEKIRILDRELRYLVNKMKYSKPKAKKEEKQTSNQTKEAEKSEEDHLPVVEDPKEEPEKLQPKDTSDACEGESCKEKNAAHDATEL